jgi:WD40 repeat protein
MHQAKINQIAVDAANRYLVTGSGDKTVRVWDLHTGTLLRTLRLPIGMGNEGEVNAVAISLDGGTVAVGGWTGLDFDGSVSIYLFDRASGRMTKRLTGLPNVIGHLAFSPDGQTLVATLGGEHGIRVYGTSDYAVIGEDRAYGDSSYGAAFDRQGRLVTTSLDGFIRLYDTKFQLLAKQQAPGGSEPFGVAFSPAGLQVAVGFKDSTKLAVLSGQDLSFQFAPDTRKLTNGSFSSVAWSADGNRLYAAGSGSNGTVWGWAKSGRGPAGVVPTGSVTIFSLLPLQDGGVVFGAADPAHGVLDAQGRRTLFQGQSIADYRGIYLNAWRLSHDGTSIEYGYEYGGKIPGRFAVAARVLTVGQSIAGEALEPPKTDAPGISVTDWQNSAAPKLNGKPLALYKHEWSRSLAIAPDGQSLLLGCDWSFRLFDRTGQERWRVPAPGVAWGVNIARNGRVAVAAFSDGTIRWYRLSDGQELLAFFTHANRKDWVLWTPTGYYDASPGGEALIGWHVNHGKDQAADFFPAAKFRNTYYRPDIVAKVLDALDEGAAVRLANSESGRKAQAVALTEQLPPVVTILSPGEGAMVSTSDVTVRFTLRSPSGEPVTGVKALVDGRPVSVARDLKVTAKAQAESDVQELRVMIPERDAEIAILAENRYCASVPAVVRVKWAGRGPGQADAFVIQPRLYILAIGVSQYQNKDLTLGFPAKDAQDFAAVLHSQKGRLYRDVTAKVLTDGEATKDDILDGLDWLRKETTSKDVAMLFLAGHGVNDSNGLYYFLPANANPDKLLRTGVVFSDIKNTLASIAGKTLFFVDTCHSGNIMGARRGVADINVVVNELASAENGAVVFASSTGKQYSLEDQAWGNGAFTKALVEGLGGKADYTGKGTISINMLDLYLSERVKQLTGGMQTPTTTKPNTVPDFPIALRR